MPVEDKELNPGLNVGIYILICLWSGFAYIGASRRLRKRLKEHLDLLRRNRHSCKRLQKEWNEFGRECFALFPVELVRDRSTLSARERAWTRKCLVEGRVYNKLNAVTDRHKRDFKTCEPQWPSEPAAKNAKEYIFVSPDGEQVKVRGLRGICEAYGLNPSHMSKVARGLYVQHRGWTIR